jgi:hypothetical protein
MSTQPSTELLSLLDSINASVSDDFEQPLRFEKLPWNPFVGLRPFESEEDMLFFGRREQTIELLQYLHTSRFLAVVGSSGSGKSSLIRAGLIPKLKAGFLVDSRDQWRIAIMRPGESPLHNLAMAVQMARDPEASLTDIVRLATLIRTEGASAIINRLSPIFLQRDVNLLLLVDQFEEIFRFGAFAATEEQAMGDEELVKKRDEASEFVMIMLELANHPSLPVYVVMTMRSDFLGDCDAFYGLPEAMNRSQYLVPRLTRQQRQESIEKPILLFNQKIAPRLLDRVLNDMGEEADQLPIMQHALMRTWGRWKKKSSGEVDLPHYEAAGTIAQALSRDAEQALDETKEPELTKRVFQLLTTKDQHGRRVRRPAYLSEILDVTKAERDKVMAVIECFRRNSRSFLTLSEGQDGKVLVDISHESLIRQWKTLREWVDEEAESRAMYLRLAEAASRYKKRKEGLWGNPALGLALDWRAEKKPNHAWGQRYHPEYEDAMSFLDQSRRRRRVKHLLYSVLGISAVVLLISAGVWRQRAQVATAYQEKDQAYREKEQLRQDEERKRQLEELQHEQEIVALRAMQQTQVAEAKLNASQQALAEAQEQREKAEVARRDADQQRKIAEDKGRQLANQLAVTKAARDDAENQRRIADEKTRYAVQQRLLTEVASAKLQVQLVETKRAVDEADRQRVIAVEAAKQEAQQRLIAEEALKLKDIERTEKEKAQEQVAILEKERAEEDERREAFMKGQPVSIQHQFLGKIPYGKGEKGALEISPEWVDAQIATFEIPELKGLPGPTGAPTSGKIRFHKCAVAQLQAALREIREKGLWDRILSWDGAFLAQSPGLRTKPTSHNLGIAFDLNLKFNPPGKPVNNGKGSLVQLAPIFANHGFEWSGTRKGFKEPAHFQLIRLDKSAQCPQPLATFIPVGHASSFESLASWFERAEPITCLWRATRQQPRSC